jgi:hypothetical protein
MRDQHAGNERAAARRSPRLDRRRRAELHRKKRTVTGTHAIARGRRKRIKIRGLPMVHTSTFRPSSTLRSIRSMSTIWAISKGCRSRPLPMVSITRPGLLWISRATYGSRTPLATFWSIQPVSLSQVRNSTFRPAMVTVERVCRTLRDRSTA